MFQLFFRLAKNPHVDGLKDVGHVSCQGKQLHSLLHGHFDCLQTVITAVAIQEGHSLLTRSTDFVYKVYEQLKRDIRTELVR